MKQRTLGAHLTQFKPQEKGLIVWALNTTNLLGYQVHLGMLPFVKAETALEALGIFSNVSNKAIAAATKAKLKQAYNIGSSVSWNMRLDNAKIIKRFGAHPERGHNIPCVAKKRVTVGVRWSLPKRDHVPDDNVLVQPHLKLEPVMAYWWRVTCEKRYRDHVHMWLLDNCT